MKNKLMIATTLILSACGGKQESPHNAKTSVKAAEAPAAQASPADYGTSLLPAVVTAIEDGRVKQTGNLNFELKGNRYELSSPVSMSQNMYESEYLGVAFMIPTSMVSPDYFYDVSACLMNEAGTECEKNLGVQNIVTARLPAGSHKAISFLLNDLAYALNSQPHFKRVIRFKLIEASSFSHLGTFFLTITR